LTLYGDEKNSTRESPLENRVGYNTTSLPRRRDVVALDAKFVSLSIPKITSPQYISLTARNSYLNYINVQHKYAIVSNICITANGLTHLNSKTNGKLG